MKNTIMDGFNFRGIEIFSKDEMVVFVDDNSKLYFNKMNLYKVFGEVQLRNKDLRKIIDKYTVNIKNLSFGEPLKSIIEKDSSNIEVVEEPAIYHIIFETNLNHRGLNEFKEKIFGKVLPEILDPLKVLKSLQ